MWGRTVHAWLVAAALLVSACVQPDVGPSGSKAAPVVNLKGGANEAALSDDERDRRPHSHDYWNGFQEAFYYDQPFQRSGSGSSFGGSISPAPAGSIVYPGTGALKILPHWNETTGKGVRLDLTYSHGGTSGGTQPLEKGRLVTIPIQPGWADLAHTRMTGWRFGINVEPDGGGSATILGHLRMWLVRGGDPLPVDAPHPDPYGAEKALVLFEANGTLRDIEPVDPPGTAQSEPPRYPEPKPVPWKTQSIRLIFAYNSTTDPTLHYSPTFTLYSAYNRTPEKSDAPPTESRKQSSNGRLVWAFPVDARMWDSPYADATQWDYLIDWAPLTQPRPSYMDGNYRLSVETSREPVNA